MSSDLGMLLYYLRALSQLQQYSHWKSKGSNYYGDHLLYQRLYDETQAEIDGVAERAIGLYGEDAIDMMEDIDTAHKILEELNGDDYVQSNIKAEQALLDLIKKLMDGETTDGLEDLLQSIASLHETHLYLLKQRAQAKEASPVYKLQKVADELDAKGYFEVASEIDEMLKEMATRAGLKLEDLLAMGGNGNG